MPIHNKLVRDKIPQIIENAGKNCVTRILSDDEYFVELKKKGFEELEEFMNANTKEEALEELADIIEIVHAFADFHGASFSDVEQIRNEKAKKRGGFREKIFLIEVEDD